MSNKKSRYSKTAEYIEIVNEILLIKDLPILTDMPQDIIELLLTDSKYNVLLVKLLIKSDYLKD